MITYVLFGVGKDQPSYMEEFIVETKTEAELEQAKEKALKEGFYNLRVLKHREGDIPDFTGTINV